MASNPEPKSGKPAGSKISKKTLIMGGGGALLLVLLGVGGWLMMSGKSKPADGQEQAEESGGHGGGHGETKTAGAPIYKALDPAFVVNLADDDGSRYLQVEVQVMAKNQSAIDAIELHMPVIRNQLLLLFSNRKVDDLRTREAREDLQKQALVEVQKILKDLAGKSGKNSIEALYFTSFVTQ